MVIGRSATGLIAALSGGWVVVVLGAQSAPVTGGQAEPRRATSSVSQAAVPASTSNAQPASSAPHQTTVRRYCVSCHNQRLKTAGLMLDGMGVAEGNWLENNGGYGMSIGHKDSDNFVRHNTIIGNKRGGVRWRAETEPMAAHRTTFENNVVRDNEGWGLFVDGATGGTLIRKNLIEDTGSGRQKTGIRVGKEAKDLTLEGNTIRSERELLDERGK